MTTFIEYHGISLAPNSFIENAVFERLTQDPLPVEAGRVWFNVTEKAFKYSTLTEQGSVIIRTFPNKEDMVAAIKAEEDRAKAAELVLTNDLAAEVQRATAKENLLEARIDALGSAFNYVGTVVGGANAVAATNLSLLEPSQKDTGDYFKVVTNGYFIVDGGTAFFAKAGDGLVWNLQGTIDIIDNTNSEVSGTVSFVKVTGSTDTGFQVDLEDQFKNRVSALETDLAQEISDRESSDTALDERVTVVEGQVNGKIGDLSTLTTDEKSTVVGAINEVDAHVDAEVARAKAAELVLTNNLSAEVQARTNAVQNVKDVMNASVYRYISVSPALVHTINHGLNTEHYLISMMVQRQDGSYYNDVAPVQEVDSNTLKVTMSTARNIKFVVKKADQLF